MSPSKSYTRSIDSPPSIAIAVDKPATSGTGPPIGAVTTDAAIIGTVLPIPSKPLYIVSANLLSFHRWSCGNVASANSCKYSPVLKSFDSLAEYLFLYMSTICSALLTISVLYWSFSFKILRAALYCAVTSCKSPEK